MATSNRLTSFVPTLETQTANVVVSRSWSLISKRNSSESPERAIADLAFRRKFDKSFLIEWWEKNNSTRHPRKTLTIFTAKTCFANALVAEVDTARYFQGSRSIPIDTQWREHNAASSLSKAGLLSISRELLHSASRKTPEIRNASRVLTWNNKTPCLHHVNKCLVSARVKWKMF